MRDCPIHRSGRRALELLAQIGREAFADPCADLRLKLPERSSPRQGLISWVEGSWDKPVKGGARPPVAKSTSRWKRPRGVRWSDYDKILVQFSGGKDSWAALLWLLEAGAPKEKMELWHQNVDGGDDADGAVASMDWPVTHAYVKAVGKQLGIPVFFQWRGQGLIGEVRRKGRHMYPMFFEDLDSRGRTVVREEGTKAGLLSGRPGFPATSNDMNTRWCSDVVKIQPSQKAILYSERFDHKILGRPPRLLFVTGERREESANRSLYSQLQPHKTHAPSKRHVDHWRPVLHLDEEEVWALMKRHKVQPHPAYELGWSHCSCFGCIYTHPTHWALMRKIAPRHFDRLAREEKRTGLTIKKGASLRELADKGEQKASFLLRSLSPEKRRWVAVALGAKPFKPSMVRVRGEWCLPLGAFKTRGGPT